MTVQISAVDFVKSATLTADRPFEALTASDFALSFDGEHELISLDDANDLICAV